MYLFRRRLITGVSKDTLVNEKGSFLALISSGGRRNKEGLIKPAPCQHVTNSYNAYNTG